MKKSLLLTYFLLNIFYSYAQVTISGTTRNNKAKKLAKVSITLVNTYDGAVSDANGNFSFTTTEKGEFTIEAILQNHKTVTQKIKIESENITLNFVLKEEINELSAVTVTAGTFEAGDKKRASTVLNSLDIVTTASANADITSAIKTLPGAQQIGEQEGLFVRGGAGYETKQFIDGAYVANPFFSGAQDIATRGRFSPFLFKGTVFSTGGYSALYGQALSSALILESIDLPDRSEGNASISPIFAGFGYQHLAKNKKSSYGVNYSYTNVGAYFGLVKQTPDFFTMPSFHSFEGNFRIKTKRGMLKFYSSFNHQELGLRRQNIDSLVFKNAFGLTNNNLYTNLSYKENLKKGWKLNAVASYSKNADVIFSEIQNQQNIKQTTGVSYLDGNNFNLNNLLSVSQLRAVFDKKISGISVLRLGSEYWYTQNTSTIIPNNGIQYSSTIKDNFFAAFGEVDYYLTNDIAAKVGGRFEYSSILKYPNFAPRVSLAYKTGKQSQMSIAYGEFYQKPENQQLLLATNANIGLGYTKATHYIANYTNNNNDYNFRAEVYYKKYNALVKTEPNFNTLGSGYAQGIEFFWRDKKSIKNLDYWISYSYLDTKRDFNNYPTQLQPTFAANHTASLVAKRFVTNWKTGFNFTYSFATGRPFYNFQQDANGKTFINDRGETINFNSLAFSVNYLPNLGKKNAKTFIVLVASVSNALNQNQIFGYNYNYRGTYKQEINPPAPQFFFFGCFFKLGGR
jgi:vitamin B12 transporter